MLCIQSVGTNRDNVCVPDRLHVILVVPQRRYRITLALSLGGILCAVRSHIAMWSFLG